MSDTERPLNDRGSRDAPRMGRFLAREGVNPSRIVSSPAVRAWTTARLIAQELGYPESDIDREPTLYEASVNDVLDVIRDFDDTWTDVMIFGHNPTFTSLVNTLTQSNIGNVPTCGVARIRCQAEKWSDVGTAPASLVDFHIPKDLK